jgi:hypothetical protein
MTMDRATAAEVEKKIMRYTRKLLNSSRSVEARTIENFQICTRDAASRDFTKMALNIRQFTDGMRRFIVSTHGQHKHIG